MHRILTIALAGLLAAAAAQTASHAASPFDGLWAASKKDCKESDGPDSKTLVDLDNFIKGKPAPLIDRYENHCRVDRKTPDGDGVIVQATCFEFWDDYNKGQNGQKATIRLAPGPNATIRIDGKPFILCKRLSDLPKSR